MAPSVARASTPTEDNSFVSSCHRPSREALQTVIDRSDIPRKSMAADVCDGDEQMFSKKVAGVPGRPFDLDDIDRLPRAVLVAWLQRRCAAAGLTAPREMELPELTEQLLSRVDEIASLARLARVVTGKPVKAGLR